jgi:hypothetical protein
MILSDVLLFLFELDADDVSGRFNSGEGGPLRALPDVSVRI